MSDVHTYKLKGSWKQGNKQTGQIFTDNLSMTVGIHNNPGQNSNVANPEELLLSAAASCYLITISTLLENRKIPYVRIELESEALVESDKGLRLDRIIHYPHIVVDALESVDTERIIRLMHHAEHTCMVSSALRGNVDVVVHPRITAEEAAQNA